MAVRILTVVALVGLAVSAGYFTYVQLRPEPTCEVCYRSVHEVTLYQIHLEDGTRQQACCPRCGLRFQTGRTDVASVEVTDFDSGERFDALDALFVENSSVNLCHSKLLEEDRSGVQYQLTWDRCLPSLIAFKDREAAEAFRRDYGGVIKTYEELLEEKL
jgi:hypothetical protein